MRVYLIGSLQNIPKINEVAKELRRIGLEVFDDWTSGGEHSDVCWREYEKQRGRSFPDALHGTYAKTVFQHDLSNLAKCDAALLILPAGKSAHLELGWVLGQNKPGWILLDNDPERYDVMYRFATGVCNTVDGFIQGMKEDGLLAR